MFRVSFIARAALLASAAVILSAAPRAAHAAELRTLTNDGRTLDYLIALPPNFDPRAPYPVLLTLPPGEQTRDMAQTALDRYWEAEGLARGWVVVTPIAQKGKSFHSGLERAVPYLLDEVSRAVVFEGGKAHLAGVSNGGKSAFRIATEYPGRFHSLTVLPGFPPDDRATLGLRSLNQLPGGVAMYVGEDDPKWLQPMRETKQRLDAYGITTTLEVWPANGHVLNIKAVELFDVLDRKRIRPAAIESSTSATDAVPPGSVPPAPAAPESVPGSSSAGPATPVPGSATAPTPAPTAAPVPPPASSPAPAQSSSPVPVSAPAPAPAPAPAAITAIDELRETNAITKVLDDFHDAAAKADFNRYFAHFAPEGVFLGTDATERWNLEAFKAFAKPHFDSGKGWTYRSTQRTVVLCPLYVPGVEIAWFDELLENDKLGVTRGSGVLRKIDGVWKVAQYNLSIPIPNDLADDTAKRIRALTPGASTP